VQRTRAEDHDDFMQIPSGGQDWGSARGGGGP
jgi:hypothetical protein